MAASAERRAEVDALKARNPIQGVVEGYRIALRRQGDRSLVGRCPFHDDGGRPNFYVYPETDSWYCYRCGVGGDVIAFIMRREGIGFVEACKRLEGSSSPATPGRTVPADPHPDRQQPAPKRERQWDRLSLEEQVVMNTACAIYRDALWHRPDVLQYVQGRGIPDWVIRSCAIGYADGHSLETYLRSHSGLRVAERLGLLHRAERPEGTRPLHEFLAGRVVVPEMRRGNCTWFMGRSIPEGRGGPKYLALGGERPVLGYERVAGRKEVYLCEGVFDYLTAVSWGLPAFSPCGTSLPADRLGFLARAEVVWGVLDGDEAGQAAADRFAEQLGARFRPVRLPSGTDLNDFGRRPKGKGEFSQLVRAGANAGAAGITRPSHD